GDGAADPGHPVAPRHRALLSIPGPAVPPVLAASEGRHTTETDESPVATSARSCTANEATGGGNDALGPNRPAPPPHRSPIAAPICAIHDVVAVREGRDPNGWTAGQPDIIAHVAANETVDRRDDAAGPRLAVAPRHRAEATRRGAVAAPGR